MRYILAIFLLITNTLLAKSQNEKAGSCPPPVSVDICYATCDEDLNCRGPNKCCPTECGGMFCVEPIAMRSVQQYKGKHFKVENIGIAFFAAL